jgi:hypothetical protein
MRILEVKLSVKEDVSPDTSWIGKYSDRLDEWDIVASGPGKGKFFRDISEDEYPRRGREFRGFEPYAGGEKPGTRDYVVNARQDYEEMSRLRNGDFSFIGVVAEARIMLRTGALTQKISSGGLWGIASDDRPQMKEAADEQLNELRNELEALGFSSRVIDEAFDDAKSDL